MQLTHLDPLLLHEVYLLLVAYHTQFKFLIITIKSLDVTGLWYWRDYLSPMISVFLNNYYRWACSRSFVLNVVNWEFGVVSGLWCPDFSNILPSELWDFPILSSSSRLGRSCCSPKVLGYDGDWLRKLICLIFLKLLFVFLMIVVSN